LKRLKLKRDMKPELVGAGDDADSLADAAVECASEAGTVVERAGDETDEADAEEEEDSMRSTLADEVIIVLGACEDALVLAVDADVDADAGAGAGEEADDTALEDMAARANL
jgi:hypothetical protein